MARAFGGFAGGLTAALGAAIVHWRGGPPSLVVFLPSFWLLVPGSLGLIGTTQLATDTGDGFATASGAIAVIVAIALGVLVGSAVGRVAQPMISLVGRTSATIEPSAASTALCTVAPGSARRRTAGPAPRRRRRDASSEAEVGGRARRRVDAHAGHHPADHDLVDAGVAQVALERGLQERVGVGLDDQRLALGGLDRRDGSRRPRCPGAKNGASGASQTCWTWNTGSPLARKALSSSLARPAAASAPTSSILPAREVVLLDVDHDQSRAMKASPPTGSGCGCGCGCPGRRRSCSPCR